MSFWIIINIIIIIIIIIIINVPQRGWNGEYFNKLKQIQTSPVATNS